AKIPAFANQLRKRHVPESWKTLLVKTAEMMAALGENNVLKISDFQEIKCPVQIGIGDRDNMVTLDEAISVFKAIPISSLLVIPNTTHPLENIPKRKLTAEIKTFFSNEL
ncbi:MAG TPA: alpha/beta hydrolase, partial [Flavobacterium sp.]